MERTPLILIIEREPTLRELFTEFLTDEGYRTCTARTGRDGLAALAAEQPALTMFNLALTDVPAAALIRASDRASTGMLLMSTWPPHAAPLLVPGIIECLAMPFELDHCIALVGRLVARALHIDGPAPAAQPAAPHACAARTRQVAYA